MCLRAYRIRWVAHIVWCAWPVWRKREPKRSMSAFSSSDFAEESSPTSFGSRYLIEASIWSLWWSLLKSTVASSAGGESWIFSTSSSHLTDDSVPPWDSFRTVDMFYGSVVEMLPVRDRFQASWSVGTRRSTVLLWKIATCECVYCPVEENVIPLNTAFVNGTGAGFGAGRWYGGTLVESHHFCGVE